VSAEADLLKAAEHGRRVMRERREREAAELRRANAKLPFVDDDAPRPARYQTAKGPRTAARENP
jgi:hypothetical protein